jgi:hypothetical protein
MQPLVLQLQAECLDSRVSILEVLRKALVVARKLDLVDAQAWIEKELNGYKIGDSAPAHRLLTGQIRVWNPYHGWQPVIFEDRQEEFYLSKCFLGQPVGELEDLLKKGEDSLQVPFQGDKERALMEGLDGPLEMSTRHVNRSAVSGIIDAVRNMVLDWCLQLEKDGIIGEGLAFSAKEKEVAAHSSYTINYNAPVTHSQIQQGSPHAVQTMSITEMDKKAIAGFLDLMKEHASELKLSVSQEDNLKATVKNLETLVATANPERNALDESLRTVRNLLEGCAGSLIASGLLFEIAKLIK